MAFTPITLPGRHINTAPIRYRIRFEHGRPRLYIAVETALLQQIKGEPRFWRLDVDPKANRARLTGLLQNDGNPATRKQLRSDASTGFTWGINEDVKSLFPDNKKVTALKNHTLTTMGIEFDIPTQPTTKP